MARRSRSSVHGQIVLFKTVIAAMGRESSDGAGRSQLKTFWKGHVVLDVVKNLWFMGRGQNVNRDRSLEEGDHPRGWWRGSGRPRTASPQTWCQRQENQSPKRSRDAGPHCRDLWLQLTAEEVPHGEERRMHFPEREDEAMKTGKDNRGSRAFRGLSRHGSSRV